MFQRALSRTQRGQESVLILALVVGSLIFMGLVGSCREPQWTHAAQPVKSVLRPVSTEDPILMRAMRPMTIAGSVVSNHDGDTITIAVTVRLSEIDAPELRQEYGKEARQQLTALCPVKSKVKFTLNGLDRYGRIVAEIIDAKQQNVNLAMVRYGAAWEYPTYSDSAELHDAEDQARKSGLGLWASKDPIAPWLYRGGKREVPNPFQEVCCNPWPGLSTKDD